MANLIKIDFAPVSNYVASLPNTEDISSEFSFIEICDSYNLESSCEDFFNWFENIFNNDYLDQINNFINKFSLPLGLSLYLALYKSICENSNTLESFLDDVDRLTDLLTGSSYSIKNLGIEDININQSFKLNDSTFLIKKIESGELNDVEKFNQLYNFIEVNIDSIVRQIQLFSVLTDFEDILQLDDYIFIYSKPENELTHEDLISKLKLYSIIVNGKILHNPVTVSNIIYPNLNISFENNSVQYRQFDDIASLLSQFNSENRLLSKFLILYQILENFEIKHDVVKAMNNGGQFKVRDFTKVANNLPSSELSYLKKILKELFKLSSQEITTNGNPVNRHILDIVRDGWDSIINKRVDLNKLNYQLEQIGFDNVQVTNFSNLVANSNPSNSNNLQRNSNEEQLINFLANSTYKLRCSIVHYKTHEFHLSDGNLDNMSELKLFLTDFLVPLLHKIISISIFSNNSPVAYPDDKLTLF